MSLFMGLYDLRSGYGIKYWHSSNIISLAKIRNAESHISTATLYVNGYSFSHLSSVRKVIFLSVTALNSQ